MSSISRDLIEREKMRELETLNLKEQNMRKESEKSGLRKMKGKGSAKTPEEEEKDLYTEEEARTMMEAFLATFKDADVDTENNVAGER
jgi:hypothetical protein